MNSPYQSFAETAFWRSGVVGSSPFDPVGLYTKKWPIPAGWKIATAGSCFAQHISRHLRKHKYNVLQTEPSPPGLPDVISSRFGYSLYSARYGNVYTLHQFHQLVEEASGKQRPRDIIWENDGRYYDALRPAVEPNGLDSPEEVIAHRTYHLDRVRAMLQSMDLLIFTLGLTEAWVHKEYGTVYPTAPGTIAGNFDENSYMLKNYSFLEIIEIFEDIQVLLSDLRDRETTPHILLTVSPVPLTGTASGDHVLQATTYSKSVLRAVAGDLAKKYDHVDYFPSYEVITNPAARGCFYEENLRSVRPEGVEAVMKVFFREHGVQSAPSTILAPAPTMQFADNSKDMPVNFAVECEEALIEAFAT